MPFVCARVFYFLGTERRGEGLVVGCEHDMIRIVRRRKGAARTRRVTKQGWAHSLRSVVLPEEGLLCIKETFLLSAPTPKTARTHLEDRAAPPHPPRRPLSQ